MKITSIHDLEKCLTTGEVSEQYEVQMLNVYNACINHRLTDAECVETKLGWFITPDGAARLWKPRKTIDKILAEKLTGAKWKRAELLAAAEKDIRQHVGATRRRKGATVVTVSEDNTQVHIRFLDISVIIYDATPDSDTFTVEAICPVEDVAILVSPRGLENEVYREAYPTKYEAERRIKSFAGTDGWAKYADTDTPEVTGERV